MNDYKNILVVRTDRIGDMVLTVPALRALKKAYPASRLTVLSAVNTRSLIDGLLFVDDVMVDDVSRGWIAYLDLVKELRRRRFDLAIIYHTKRRTNSACFLAGIPCRLGYRNEKFGFLLNRPVRDERQLGLKHEAEYCLDLLREIGVVSHDLSLEIACDKGSEVWADNFMTSDFPKGNVIVLHADASCPTRRWPAENFASLGDLLVEKLAAQIVIVGAEGGKPIAQDIVRRMKSVAIDLTGQLSLAQLASFLKRVKLLVSSDTGPVHIAAAVGTPLVCLFLRTQAGLNPERWRPLGDRCTVLVNKPGEEIVVDRHSRVISGSFGSTTPFEVLDAARKLLGR
jgi:lipopolysaccharide heptosyltransferase II